MSWRVLARTLAVLLFLVLPAWLALRLGFAALVVGASALDHAVSEVAFQWLLVAPAFAVGGAIYHFLTLGGSRLYGRRWNLSLLFVWAIPLTALAFGGWEAGSLLAPEVGMPLVASLIGFAFWDWRARGEMTNATPEVYK